MEILAQFPMLKQSGYTFFNEYFLVQKKKKSQQHRHPNTDLKSSKH